MVGHPSTVRSYHFQASKSSGGGGGEQGKDKERKKKDSIMSDLAKFIDKRVRVKFQGGREAEGVLKGYDALVNLVLDETVEFLRGRIRAQIVTNHVTDPDDPYKITGDSRPLGLIVVRGTTLTVVQPVDGTQAIDNPFLTADE